MGKQLKIKQDVLNEIKLIAAKANAKSMNSFLEDLYTHWINKSATGETPSLESIISDLKSDGIYINLYIDTDVLRNLRIIAAETNGTSLKAYMEAIIYWLCDEHRANGRVWIDDTDVQVLPIRRRK